MEQIKFSSFENSETGTQHCQHAFKEYDGVNISLCGRYHLYNKHETHATMDEIIGEQQSNGCCKICLKFLKN